MITDAQVHIWNANTPEDPWGPGAESHLPDPMPAERLMWGSDQTQTMGKSRGTYAQNADIIRMYAAAYLPAADLQMMMHGTAARGVQVAGGVSRTGAAR